MIFYQGVILTQEWVPNIRISLFQTLTIFYNFFPVDSSMIQTDTHTFRNSEDKKSNTNRRHSADLCMVNNLKILNGRKIGDLTGKYTCHQYNGSSVVDYIIAGKKYL